MFICQRNNTAEGTTVVRTGNKALTIDIVSVIDSSTSGNEARGNAASKVVTYQSETDNK